MDMNELLIRSKHEVYGYELKEGTSSSYYLTQGKRNVLPERISFSKDGFKPISQTGRAKTELKVGQIVGKFKKNEESSCYKLYDPYEIYSSIWQAKDYPIFTGYGDIGISKESGRIASTKDLFIIYSPQKGTLEIHLFKGLVEFKEEALSFLKGYVLKREKAQEWASEWI
jgi:hypothetical protein